MFYWWNKKFVVQTNMGLSENTYLYCVNKRNWIETRLCNTTDVPKNTILKISGDMIISIIKTKSVKYQILVQCAFTMFNCESLFNKKQ